LGGSALAAFACNDETVEEVDKTVCYSGMRWVGDKRGSPEMFPGRDCVGCHIDNDGPPLAVGGTIYSYVLGGNQPGLLAQTGTDCFGIEGVYIEIEDADGQVFPLTTNRSGNFYIEGNPDDFAKPFVARIPWVNPGDGREILSQMSTTPHYGGCAKCHDPSATAYQLQDGDSPDELVIAQARIGLPGYGPGDGNYTSIEDELNHSGCGTLEDPLSNRTCENLIEEYGPPPGSSAIEAQ
jgi:hypothetical protein